MTNSELKIKLDEIMTKAGKSKHRRDMINEMRPLVKHFHNITDIEILDLIKKIRLNLRSLEVEDPIFCPKCGELLYPNDSIKLVNIIDDEYAPVVICDNCGIIEFGTDTLIYKEKFRIKDVKSTLQEEMKTELVFTYRNNTRFEHRYRVGTGIYKLTSELLDRYYPIYVYDFYDRVKREVYVNMNINVNRYKDIVENYFYNLEVMGYYANPDELKKLKRFEDQMSDYSHRPDDISHKDKIIHLFDSFLNFAKGI